MKKVVLDIETAGCDFDLLDDASKDFMLKYAESEEDKELVKESTSFYPLTAEIVAIGMLEVDSDKAIMLYQDRSNNPPSKIKEGGVEFFSFKTERELLIYFWNIFREYQQIITFNGRAFDCPFIMIRSAVCKIKSSKNLMPNRYSSDMHIDLLDRLTFYGSVRRKFNLHMWCKAFGIKSPKEGEVTGYQVKDLFAQGKFLDIARYCVGDIVATKELYLYWEKYINVK